MKNKFQIFVIIFIVLLFPCAIKAQTNYEDVIYMKNGAIIHGMIIEQIPNVSFKIQANSDNIFVCKIEEIEKITKEEIETKFVINYSKVKKYGYINITEIGFGTGSGYSLDAQTINGYLFKPMISVGLGTGIYVDKSNSLTLIPLFIDLRAYMLNKPVSPFMDAAAGYSFSTETNSKGGRLVNLAFGVRAYVSSKSALLFSLGYKLQTVTRTGILYNNQRYSDKEYYGYINFKAGLMF